nr:MAG TPA: hypothetical protein [Caudoviricetes sp.]
MKISAMAKIYKERIKSNIMTLEEVPERWKEDTKELLEDDKMHDENSNNQ